MTTFSKCPCGHPGCNQYVLSTQRSAGFDLADAQLYSQAENMRDALKSISIVMIDEIHDWKAVAERMQTTARNALEKLEKMS